MKRVFLLAVLLSGCGNQFQAQVAALGTDATVDCYSNGVSIYHGKSRGIVMSDADGNISFKDRETDRLVEIHESQCVIRH